MLESTLRGTVAPVPAGTFLALCTADLTDANITTNEVTVAAWPAYTRKDLAVGGVISSGWSANVNGVSSNAKVVAFPATNGASTVTVTHLGIYDALTGGNLLYHSPLTTSKSLLVGDVLSWGIGSIVVTID